MLNLAVGGTRSPFSFFIPSVVSFCILGLLTVLVAASINKNEEPDSKEEIPNPHLNVSLSDNPADVHFYFFPTLQDSSDALMKEIIYNDATSLANSGFKQSRQTLFIIHGFKADLYGGMPQTIKNAFLASGLDYNIIVVDWGKLATPQPPVLTYMLYSLVTRFSVPIVGQRLTDFLLFLREQNAIAFNRLYLIGHSLGAHLSGIAGGKIFDSTAEKIQRITGLDPAGPNYYPHLPERNLMKDDAVFVDVIHTNVGIKGDLTSDGHADFFPNGGYEQPNCAEVDLNASTLGSCSHSYSFQIYAASITKSFPACSCPDYRLTQSLGNCSAICDNPVLLGYPSVTFSPSGDYYLEATNPP